MGLRDTIFGRSKAVRPNLDALFALPSAAITLQAFDGVVSSGHAGVCWKPPAGTAAHEARQEMAELLALDDRDTGTPPPAGELTEATDSFGYGWLLLADAEIDDLVARVHLVNSTLSDNGWGPQLLCSVFSFVPGPEADAGTSPFYLVYLFKRGTFYPFAPTGGEKRDTELELRIRSVLGADLPVEADLTRWFPLWDVPVGR